MRILLLAPSGAIAEALTALGLTEEDGPDQALAVVATSNDASGVTQEIRLGMKACPAKGPLAQSLNRSVVGRNLKRLTPLDGGHRFARASRQNKLFREAAMAADLIIALERDSIFAAWIALQRWASPNARAVYGLAPGVALLSAMRTNGNS